MSRRPPAGADRTEQNRAMLKQLVKLEANKSCADCKRNKHPRWASWNLGIFLCIRCSGIHRGMGTHISRVKSVDLDSWTDEQMQNMVRWGNTRANKYWEHKLAEGHVPNEAKIENFIRTKYDSRRWVMDGPMPDPSTLDDGEGAADDDVPLNVVREKAIERSASLRNGGGRSTALSPPSRGAAPSVDLFGDTEDISPARASSTEPPAQKTAPPKASAAPPRQTKPGESLLGLDFLGAPSSAPARPASTGPNTTASRGRADLKSSILSLYAAKPAAPAPQPQAPPQNASNLDAFAGMHSKPSEGLNDAFSSLSFNSQQPSQVRSSPFSNLASPTVPSAPNVSRSALSGGSFFDTKAPAPVTATAARKESFGGDWGDFSSSASPITTTKSPPANTSSMGDLFDMSSPPIPSQPATMSPPAPVQAQQANYPSDSAFNLSKPVSQPAAAAPKPAAPALSNFSNFNTADAWGSSDPWANADAPSQPTAPRAAQPSGAQTVQQDEEFGEWGHASPIATTSTAPKQSSSGGFGGGSDDLFGNVWG
ncbi:putative GTPase activating protein for Arf-domain-containing protein [Neohortaea acidophila]|uniref:Putative GTPase activating protein for Arf-domain-containing protein n=1 Tax=Neohortaea acidophila TaxID=245834 RepID=A0A6A6PZH5_9PEZI|nr:putative GTPase activating protein for Arf-domain-containing protein [Neohortaea acidophila]KAF2485425.1 putative GTPase activating protein for Arf-domain-containing protein [Neohortaea acidophila]